MKIYKLAFILLFLFAELSVKAQTYYNEPYRGQIHFSAPKGWVNDPCGLAYYNGEYHLFYQYNPYGTQWSTMHWGHAVSTDLVHWKNLDIALYPDEHGPIWSGGSVIDQHNHSGLVKDGVAPMLMFYTSAGAVRTQRLAYTYDGRNFIKHPNTIIPFFAPGNRDPQIIWHEPTQKWVMVLYATVSSKHTVFFYNSSNLLDWEYLSEIQGEDPPIENHLFECNDFYEIAVSGDETTKKWILTGANGKYDIGTFDGTTFTPEIRNISGIGGTGYYAGRTFANEPLNRIVDIGWWKTDTRTPGMTFNQSMTLPVEIKLVNTPQGLRLTRTPVPELNQLRNATHNFGAFTLTTSDSNPLAAIDNELIELRTKFNPGTNGIVTFNVRGISITYHALTEKITVGSVEMDAPKIDNEIDITLYTDRIGVEVFVNGGLYHIPLNSNLDPTNRSLSVQASGEAINFSELDVYELNRIWPNTVDAPAIQYPNNHGLTINTNVSPILPTLSNINPLPAYKTTAKVSGSGANGYVNGARHVTRYSNPIDLAFDKLGNIYVTEDGNNCIRKIDANGNTSILAGSETRESGNVYGTGTEARFNAPLAIDIHPTTGDLYIVDANVHCIKRITPTGEVSWFAGSTDGTAGNAVGTPTETRFDYPAGLAFDKDGNLYVADRNNSNIKKYNAQTGTFSIFAGSSQGYLDHSTGTTARFSRPTYVATDDQGNVYVADRSNDRIRKISPSGAVTTVAGSGVNATQDGQGISASFTDPIALAVGKDGKIYVADYTDDKIRAIDVDGNVTTLIGNNGEGNVDGTELYAKINAPFGIKVGPDGNVYFVERDNHDVKMVLLNPYSMSPALPDDLTFNPQTGEIAGTPTVLLPETDYNINVYNEIGEVAASTTIKISVTDVLPVSLLKFEAKKEKAGAVLLTWQTGEEKNNSHFILYKSADGINFTELDKKYSAGNHGAHYHYTDKTPLVGKNYYRLVQVDLDGTSTELGIRVVELKLNAEEGWEIYPNPSNGETINLSVFAAQPATKQVKIYNTNGALVFNKDVFLTQQVMLNLSHQLPSGVYIVNIENLGTKKMVVK